MEHDLQDKIYELKAESDKLKKFYDETREKLNLRNSSTRIDEEKLRESNLVSMKKIQGLLSENQRLVKSKEKWKVRVREISQ